MYPNLYYFFFDVFGISIPFLKAVNSFGFFVAMAFVVGGAFYTRELKRKEGMGLLIPGKIKRTFGAPATTAELVGNGVLGFFLGFKLLHAFMNSEVFGDFPAFLFSAQGNIIGGVLGAAGMAYWRYAEAKKTQLPKPEEREVPFHSWEHVGNLIVIAVIFGFIGAKLFAWFEVGGNFIEFISDPFQGLTMYGGLICAAIAMTVYMRKNNLPVWHFYDAAAPALMLAYGVGRIGCHVSGDGDWGIVNTAPKPGWMSFLPDWMWAYQYPNNVNGVDTPIPGCVYEEKYCMMLEQPVFPTPFYETVMCVLFFGVLWMLRKRISIPGVLFFVYLFLNGIERLLIESIRVNKPMDFLGMQVTQAQLISGTFLIAGIAGIVYLLRKNKAGTPAA